MSPTRLLLYAFALLTIFGMSTTAAAVRNDERNNGASWLAHGFQNNDSEPLRRFLEAWHKRHRAVADDKRAKKPQLEREAYAVFRAFFVPSKPDLEKAYVVIQKELKVTLVDDDFSGLYARMENYENGDMRLSTPSELLSQLQVISRVTLHDFRPAVSIEGPKVLYLTRDHLHELLEFLAVEPKSEFHHVPLVDRYWDLEHGADPWVPEKDDELTARKRRLAYLNSQLNIIPGHFGTGWHFATHPLAYNLYLNQDRTRAVVAFRQGYGGGEAYLKRTDKGDWVVVARQHDWME